MFQSLEKKVSALEELNSVPVKEEELQDGWLCLKNEGENSVLWLIRLLNKYVISLSMEKGDR